MHENEEYSLTVIIPNYNKQKYLYECVQSVFRQTLRPEEVIIVDDFSSDNSRCVIEKLCEEHKAINAIYLEKNGGVSHARNIGLHCAKTQYVTFLDSDDFYVNPKKLENEMELIKKNGKNIVAYSQVVLAEDDGTLEKRIKVNKKDYLTGNIFRKVLIGKFRWPSLARDYCVKKSILENLGGYNENRNLYEDLEVLLKLSKDNFFLCTYEDGSAYRQLKNGLSQRDLSEHRRVRAEIFNEMIVSFPVWKKIMYIFQKKWQEFCRWVVVNCFWRTKRIVKVILISYQNKFKGNKRNNLL